VATLIFLLSTPIAFFSLYYGGGFILSAILSNINNSDAQFVFEFFVVMPLIAIFFVSAVAIGAYTSRAAYRKMRGKQIAANQISD
jgi:hypothetical protein